MHVLVQDNPARRRFEILVDGGLAGYAEYEVRHDALVFTHTVVDPARRGQGVGTELARGALQQLRDRSEQVVPRCSFFARYVEEHPEFADLVTA